MNNIDVKNRHIEKQFFIDSDFIHFHLTEGETDFSGNCIQSTKIRNKIKIELNKEVDIHQIYVKEFILNHTNTSIDLNKVRFLVLRCLELSKDSNNVLYNTSAFNPDTDIILYKTCCYPDNLHFESKMMVHIENPLHTRDLTLQFLDDQGNILSNMELGQFFLDVKVVINNYIVTPV
jgi:hypothetical protein